MIDPPFAPDLVRSVAGYLRQGSGSASRSRFEDKVAVNALEIAHRELENGRDIEAREARRLRDLIGRDSDLESLNDLFCRGLLAGEIDPGDPEVKAHLWKTTMDKLSIDQPLHASYRAELAIEERS
jgi:hypothetical protein